MNGEATDYGRVAIDFVESLESLRTTKDVLAAVEAALENFGFEHFVVADLPPHSRQDAPHVLGMKGPIGWQELYFAERYHLCDPVVRFCRASTRPFEWREIPVPDEPRSREMMMRARDFGLVHGLTLPIHNLSGQTSIFSMSSGALPFVNRYTKPALHLMTLYAYEKLRETEPGRPVARVLTAREREVLTWAAAGKSASSIATLLGITERTVTAHIVNAAHKLGARNKTQAVAIALRRKLIEL